MPLDQLCGRPAAAERGRLTRNTPSPWTDSAWGSLGAGSAQSARIRPDTDAGRASRLAATRSRILSMTSPYDSVVPVDRTRRSQRRNQAPLIDEMLPGRAALPSAGASSRDSVARARGRSEARWLVSSAALAPDGLIPSRVAPSGQ